MTFKEGSGPSCWADVLGDCGVLSIALSLVCHLRCLVVRQVLKVSSSVSNTLGPQVRSESLPFSALLVTHTGSVLIGDPTMATCCFDFNIFTYTVRAHMHAFDPVEVKAQP